jgi:secretion/DNA translocation related TadE-like protein
MTTLLVGLHLGAAVIARHRAEAAADLAALAAAGVAVEGVQTACDRAGEVAAAMAGTVTSCRLVGWDALVEVHVPAAVTLPGTDGAVGRARAGPVPSTSASDAAPPLVQALPPDEPATPRPVGSRSPGRPTPRTTSGRSTQMGGPADREIRVPRIVRGPPDDSAHHRNARRDICTDQR